MEEETLSGGEPGPAVHLGAESSSEGKKASEEQVNPPSDNNGNKATNLQAENQKEVENVTTKPPQSSEASTPKLAPLPTTSAFKFDYMGRLSDPDLTDDTVIFEAPSFIVPFVYEKPPKETFLSFKESVEKRSQTNLGREENNNKESAVSGDEKKGGSEDQSEDDEDGSDDFFSSRLGKFVTCLGMNLVEEHVQGFLLRNSIRQYDKDKDSETLGSINSLKKNLGTIKHINTKFHFKNRHCHLCQFKTESTLVLQNHLEKLHFKDGFALCSFCSLTSRNHNEILTHMVIVHGVKAKVEPQLGPYQCSQCDFGHKWKHSLIKHKNACERNFKIERNQEPPPDWAPPAKTPRSRTADYGLRNRPYMDDIMSLYKHCSTSKTPPFPYVGQAPQTKAPNHPNSRNTLLKSQQPASLPSNVALRIPLRPDATAFFRSNTYVPLAMHNSLLPKPPPLQRFCTPNGLQNPRSGATSVETNGMRITNNIGPVRETVCEICDFNPKDFDLLKEHMLLSHHVDMKHLMPANFRCSICVIAFFTKEGLSRHLLGDHSLISPDLKRLSDEGLDAGKCPLCSQVFRCNLLGHVQMGHKRLLTNMGSLFSCHNCPMYFNSRELLDAHSLATHGVSTTNSTINSLQAANSVPTRPVFSRPGVETTRPNQSVQKRSSTPFQEEVIEISDDEPEVATPDPDTSKSSPEVIEISDDED